VRQHLIPGQRYYQHVRIVVGKQLVVFHHYRRTQLAGLVGKCTAAPVDDHDAAGPGGTEIISA
jgi:hypothetical protein